MMSLEAIRELSDEASREAKRHQNEPLVFSKADLDRAMEGDISAIRHIPNMGTYLPKGWERVSLEKENAHGVYMGDNDGFGAYFVDKSRFGQPGEPALTLQEFIECLKPGLGYGIVQEGPFQVKIGVYALNGRSGLKALASLGRKA